MRMKRKTAAEERQERMMKHYRKRVVREGWELQ